MLSVGQRLWYVPSQHRWQSASYVTVKKGGRKWAELERGFSRIALDSLYADGGQYSSPGRCYLSKEEHDQEVERQTAWSSLKRRLDAQYRCPDGVDSEDIRKVYSLLFPND